MAHVYVPELQVVSHGQLGRAWIKRCHPLHPLVVITVDQRSSAAFNGYDLPERSVGHSPHVAVYILQRYLVAAPNHAVDEYKFAVLYPKGIRDLQKVENIKTRKRTGEFLRYEITFGDRFFSYNLVGIRPLYIVFLDNGLIVRNKDEPCAPWRAANHALHLVSVDFSVGSAFDVEDGLFGGKLRDLYPVQ